MACSPVVLQHSHLLSTAIAHKLHLRNIELTQIRILCIKEDINYD